MYGGGYAALDHWVKQSHRLVYQASQQAEMKFKHDVQH